MKSFLSKYIECNLENGWEAIYSKLNQISVKHNSIYGMTEANKNRAKNRYRDVLPYDHTRVILESIPDDNNDYINANHIKWPHCETPYILTQGPLKNTVDDFWRMVWEQNCKTIVMLNNLIEKHSVKCEKYWPNLGVEMSIRNGMYILKNMEEQNCGSFVIRQFQITMIDKNVSESRYVKQYHYTAWPDFGIPQNSNSFVAMLMEVYSRLFPVGCSQKSEKLPSKLIIHCSAGIGRSGCFILVLHSLHLVNSLKMNYSLDPFSLLIKMRECRYGLIQTSEQLKFSLDCIVNSLGILYPIEMSSIVAELQNQKFNAEKEDEDHSQLDPFNGGSKIEIFTDLDPFPCFVSSSSSSVLISVTSDKESPINHPSNSVEVSPNSGSISLIPMTSTIYSPLSTSPSNELQQQNQSPKYQPSMNSDVQNNLSNCVLAKSMEMDTSQMPRSQRMSTNSVNEIFESITLNSSNSNDKSPQNLQKSPQSPIVLDRSCDSETFVESKTKFKRCNSLDNEDESNNDANHGTWTLQFNKLPLSASPDNSRGNRSLVTMMMKPVRIRSLRQRRLRDTVHRNSLNLDAHKSNVNNDSSSICLPMEKKDFTISAPTIQDRCMRMKKSISSSDDSK